MNRVSICLCTLLFLIAWNLRTEAQVSFFQPPTYSGQGNVFIADFNSDGKPDILTSTFSLLLSAPAQGSVDLGNGDGTFQAGIPISGTPLAVADFNGDGKPDILEQGTGTLLVLLGNGDGTFQSAISSPSGASLSTIAIADLNADGIPDVVGIFNDALLVYLSKADGTFANPASYNLGFALQLTPVIAFGDFNGDGKPDVLVTIDQNLGVASQELVFLGKGDGTFQSPLATAAGTILPGYTVVGDFNGDGKLDVVISSPSCDPFNCTVYISLGNGDGTFGAPTAAFHGSGSILDADLNGDGKLDLVLEQDPTVGQVFLGNGDGTFTNMSNYVLSMPTFSDLSPSSPTGIAMGDFNRDGKPDLALGTAVLLGNGDGSFQGVPLGSCCFDTQAVTGDFDKNGTIDLATTEGGSVTVLSNDGAGVLSLIHTYILPNLGSLPQNSFGIAAADFNGDGNLDLAVVAITGDRHSTETLVYSVLFGNGDGSFQSPISYPQSITVDLNTIPTIVAGDFNGDHKSDVAIGGLGNQSLAVFLGNGDGTFSSPVTYFDNSGRTLLIGDFNSDGKPDLAIGVFNRPSSIETGILYGNGDGTFQPIVFPTNLSGFLAEFTGDLNNDGNPDLISEATSSPSQVALGNGDGTFTVLSALQTSVVGIADLNGDGKLDLVTNLNAHTGFQLGNGDGTFGVFTSLIQDPSDGGIIRPLFADMNGDGRIDILFPWDVSPVGIGGPSRVDGVGVLVNRTMPGFDLFTGAVSPATIVAGTSATSTITAYANFGFNSAIILGCAGLPSGMSCAFSPASIAGGSGISTVTITTSSGTPAGTYAIRIQGASGSVSDTETLSIAVQAPSNFQLSPASGSPTSQTISAGQSAQFSLAITPTGSFNATVNFSCSVTPVVASAVTCSLSNSSMNVDSSGTQTLGVTVGTTAQIATRVTGDSHSSRSLLLYASIFLGPLGLLSFGRRRVPGIAIVLLIGFTYLGCGSGNSSTSHGSQGTPAGTYNVTITATGAGVSHQVALQVIVQ